MTHRQVGDAGVLWRRVFGFGLAPAFAALSPLVMLPAISYTLGAQAWGAVALGQSIGGGGAVLVELGWALTGPQNVAASQPWAQRRLYGMAMRTKAVVIGPIGAACAASAFALAPTYRAESAVMAVAAASYGLTVAWYFIGTGSPLGVLLLDAGPKLLGTAVGSLSLVLGYPLVVLPICLLSGGIAGPLAGLVVVRRIPGSSTEPAITVWRSLRSQLEAVTARGFSAVYTALPVTLVALAAPALVPGFAAIERLMRMALLVLQTVPNALQAWIGSAPDDATLHARTRRAILWNLALGLIAGCAFAALAPYVGMLLFGRAVSIDVLGCALAGVVILLTCTSRATGSLGLVAIARVDAVAWCAAIAAVLGLVLVPALSALWGIPGGFAGEILAEATVLVIEYAVLRKRIPGLP
jgi:hypothetical protein